jgi:dihydroorotate dehydrogenase
MRLMCRRACPGASPLSFRAALRQQTRMMSLLTAAAMPLLRRMDAERAHELAMWALRFGWTGRAPADDARLAVRVLGLAFPNPIGLAAGFDKNAIALPGLMRLGFGCIETGTVTLLPQPGNPRPRIFRLAEDGAIINRMGFNNDGVMALAGRLAGTAHRVPIGVNVGLNRQGAVARRDFPALVAAVAPYADYVVVNVSSPNTPGLRDLQAAERLGEILHAIGRAVPEHPPLLVKLAPDLAGDDLPAIVATCVSAGIAGLVVSNTTIARPPGLHGRNVSQAGGLSGTPLFAPSTAMLARVARLAAGRLVLIGVGGVASGREVLAKLRAGASLVQLYTGFTLHGPALIPRIKRELLAALAEDGFADVQAAIGADTKD